jgi:hypothetical protein
MGPGGLGEEPPAVSSGHSGPGSGGGRAVHCYQPPPRPFAPPSPPLNFDARNRRAPIDIVATSSVSLTHDKPANFKEVRQSVAPVNKLIYSYTFCFSFSLLGMAPRSSRFPETCSGVVRFRSCGSC